MARRLKRLTKFSLLNLTTQIGNLGYGVIELPKGFVLELKQVKFSFTNLQGIEPNNVFNMSLELKQQLRSGEAYKPLNISAGRIHKIDFQNIMKSATSGIEMLDFDRIWNPPDKYFVEGRFITALLYNTSWAYDAVAAVDLYGFLVPQDVNGDILASKELAWV